MNIRKAGIPRGMPAFLCLIMRRMRSHFPAVNSDRLCGERRSALAARAVDILREFAARRVHLPEPRENFVGAGVVMRGDEILKPPHLLLHRLRIGRERTHLTEFREELHEVADNRLLLRGRALLLLFGALLILRCVPPLLARTLCVVVELGTVKCRKIHILRLPLI